MKKLILFTFTFLFSILVLGQGTPVKTVRIANSTTALGENLSVGNQVYNIALNELWVVQTAVASTATLTTASGSFLPVNGDGVTNLSAGTVAGSTYEILSSTGNSIILPSATGTDAGLLSATDKTSIEANNTKISYTDAAAVSANTDKVGITVGQASDIIANTLKISYTDGGAVAANTAKVGITPTQISDITANNAKITYLDGAIVSANADHAGTITGNPHSVGKSDVGLGNVPNTDFTSAVGANTAKVGITTTQANNITANNSKISYSDAAAVAANTAKTGITAGQASAIVTNTAKTGITAGQASEITANTAKISYTDAGAVAANTAKVGITTTQADDITANNAKTGITAGQTSAIIANTAKVSNVSTQLSVGTRAETSLGISTDGGANDVTIPIANTSQAGLMSGDQFDKLAAIDASADINYIFYTENFEENDGTANAHSLSHTAQTNGAVVSINGHVLKPSNYTLTSTTVTIGLPVAQYDAITISYNY